jgi:hypothetical protein
MKFLALLLLVVACGKESDYIYKVEPYRELVTSENYRLISEGGQVDIVWVIDNSGSMSDIQQSVITNADLFMQEFIKIRGLDWKMSLLSTDINDAPYLGMASPFNYSSADPVGTFRDAVGRLGINGSGTEKTFEPIVKNLNNFSSFLRPSAFLVLIFVTDEDEQSSINAGNFLNDMVARKGGRMGMIRAYGAFDASDLGCTSITYAGSPFETVINATGGKAIGTCSTGFGTELAKLGNDIVSTVSSPVVMLAKRPVPSTIQVVYKGVALPGGARADGGLWVYDPDVNGVRFHDYSFLDVNEKFIQIVFVTDQGQQ